MPQSPQVGAIEEGHKFKGGDPSDPANWEAVSGNPQSANGQPTEPGIGDRLKQAWNGTLPLTGYGRATLQGVTNLVHSGANALEGLSEMGKSPWNIGGPAGPVFKGAYDTVKSMGQVPGAIRDINASPDPAGHYINTAAGMASDAAIQALLAAGTEGVMRGKGTTLANEKPLPPVNIKMPGEIAPEAVRPRAYAQPAAPIPPRSGLMLPGEVTPNTAYDNVGALRSKLVDVPQPDPYAGVDQLRTKLTAPYGNVPEASALGQRPVPSGPSALPSVSLGEGGTTAGEKAATKNFMTSNPSALGRVKPVEGAPISPERIPGEKAGAEVKEQPIAKLEKPSAKPVEAKPKPSADERRTGYMFGEHADAYDPENLAHRKIKDMTHDQLAKEANDRSLKGKTAWKRDDFSRSTASHGKGSNPNASYVRGELLKEQNYIDSVNKSKGLRSKPPSGDDPWPTNIQNFWQQGLFGQEPAAQDVGDANRNANPEPTRAEVKAGREKSMLKKKEQ
jgi:hypothetical protein